MARLGAVIVAAAMVVISAAFGAVLFLGAGFGGAEATVCAVAALTGFALCGIVARHRRAAAPPDRTGDLSRGVSDLARQVADLGRRVAAMEGKVADAVEQAESATEPLLSEIGEIGLLLKQLAEAVHAHDVALQSAVLHEPALPPPPPSAPMPMVHAAPAPLPAPSPSPPMLSAPPPVRLEPLLRAPAETVAVPPRREVAGFRGLAVAAATATVAEAVGANRLEFHLQPILTLPQRKVRYYEALARLRTADAELVVAGDFIDVAESARLMPRIDNQMLFRCVKVARRLVAKKRDVGLFCNISASTLADGESFAQLAEFLETNRTLAPALVFEFTQAAYRAFGPIENESLAAMRGWGFRFSMDRVADLKIEPRDLAERGFRFLKVPAALLLDRSAAGTADIHAADLSSLLTRFGIELIAERIESEGTVVDLLDYDVKYGQGYLFSQPRPVRAEVLQSGAERADDDAGSPARAEVRAEGAPRGVAQLAVAAARGSR